MCTIQTELYKGIKNQTNLCTLFLDVNHCTNFNTYGESILNNFEFLVCVLVRGHHFANDGFDIVHPFHVFGAAEVVHFLHKTVIFLPKGHPRMCENELLAEDKKKQKNCLERRGCRQPPTANRDPNLN